MPPPISTAPTEREISLEKQLLAIRLESTKTAKDLANVGTKILDAYNRQVKKANEQVGVEKQLLLAQARKIKFENEILKLEEGISKSILTRGMVQNLIDDLRQKEMHALITILGLESKLREREELRAKLSSRLNKLQLGFLDEFISKSEDFAKETPGMRMGIVAAFLLKNALNVFKEMDEAAAAFRKTIGATRVGTFAIEKDARAIAFDFAHIGVSIKDAYAAFEATAKTIGTTRATSKAMASDMALMAAQLGISSQTSSDFLKTMGMVGRSTMDSQRDMILFTQSMTEAAGIPLGEIMSDVANASKTSYQFLSRDPLILAKAAIEARKMGTSLESATSSAKSLIDFTSSIKSEMEASVLVGQSLNLQKARELAYHRDIEGLNKEILRLAKEVNFEQLDPFQQEAVAKAFGKTSGEVAQILQAEREWRNIEAKAAKDPELKKQLDRYRSLEKSTKDRAKAEADSIRNQLRMRSNQAALTALSQSWHALVQRLAEKFLPPIAATLEFIVKIMGQLNNSWVAWIGLIGTASVALISIFSLTSKFIGMLLGAIGKGVGKAAEGLMGGIARGLKMLGTAAASPSTWLGIAAILALSAAFLGMAFGISLILKALPKAAEGFKIFAEAIGMMSFKDILKITALAGAMSLMLPVLLPFSVGAAAAGAGFMLLGKGLTDVVSGLRELRDMTFVGLITQTISLSSALKHLSDTISDIPDVDIVKLKALGSVDIGGREKDTGVTPAEGSDVNNKILNELQALRKDLASGVLQANVYLDTQVLETGTSRANDFKGNLGPTRRRRGR